MLFGAIPRIVSTCLAFLAAPEDPMREDICQSSLPFSRSERSVTRTVFRSVGIGTRVLIAAERFSIPGKPHADILLDTRTLWSRDSPGAPPAQNLYGNHPIYFEHREAAGKTHGVFLLNSNGMDFKINSTEETGQYLEYNTLGGVVDLYFMAGPSPTDVARQYSEVIGKPTMSAS